MDCKFIMPQLLEYNVDGYTVSMSSFLSSSLQGYDFQFLGPGFGQVPTAPPTQVRAFGSHSTSPSRLPPTVVAGTMPLLLALQANTEPPWLDGKEKDGFVKFQRQ